MNDLKLEKLANELDSIRFESSNETRYFSYPVTDDDEWDIEVNADVVCKYGEFDIDIQYIKVLTDRGEFYVGDGLYPFFEKEIEKKALDLDWSF